MQVGLGCVDVRFPDVEEPETIAERVETAIAHIGADRLTLNPDCGFAPREKGHEVPLDESFEKNEEPGGGGGIAERATRLIKPRRPVFGRVLERRPQDRLEIVTTGFPGG
ncbi:MAG: hypothetical protein Ct9H300mP1_06990 [Planctomycetaceae bacterium]|nr:MAG: hypothetical protein Ct9H300mP1_06990 [Planctomycetaceae bacterium]